jgi:DNA repair protein RadC
MATQPVYRTMRDVPDDERPRERLIAHGPEVLSDSELLAIVLGSGSAGENVVDLARRILEEIGGLGGLTRADVAALQRSRGLGPAKAAQLAAAIELGRRAGRIDHGERPLLTSPEAVFQYLGNRFMGKTEEQAYVLALDSRGRLLGSATAVSGGVNGVTVRGAEVFREPVVLRATQAIIVHNHPSGDPRPSKSDILTTKSLIAAGSALGIDLVDHVIVGQNRFVSMKREGLAFHDDNFGADS